MQRSTSRTWRSTCSCASLWRGWQGRARRRHTALYSWCEGGEEEVVLQRVRQMLCVSLAWLAYKVHGPRCPLTLSCPPRLTSPSPYSPFHCLTPPPTGLGCLEVCVSLALLVRMAAAQSDTQPSMSSHSFLLAQAITCPSLSLPPSDLCSCRLMEWARSRPPPQLHVAAQNSSFPSLFPR